MQSYFNKNLLGIETKDGTQTSSQKLNSQFSDDERSSSLFTRHARTSEGTGITWMKMETYFIRLPFYQCFPPPPRYPQDIFPQDTPCWE